MKRFFLPLCMLCLVWACGPQNGEDTSTSENGDTKAPTIASEDEAEPDTKEADLPLIYEDQVFGIRLGQDIAAIELPLEEGQVESGEGPADVLFIKSESGASLGYLYGHIDEEGKVGTTVVTTENAQTEEGIRVGMTFGELKERISDFDLSGSPTEPKVVAYYKKFGFTLDYESTEYEVKPEEVPEEAKILEIVLILKVE